MKKIGKRKLLTLQKQQRAVRRRNLGRSIDLLWTSLRSHLADAVKSRRGDRGEAWQALCVREYAESIYTAAVELHELTKIDFPPDRYYSMNKPI